MGRFGVSKLAVFVVDKRKQPAISCSETRTRLLLERGRAVVRHLYPFMIRLKGRIGGEIGPARVKVAGCERGICL